MKLFKLVLLLAGVALGSCGGATNPPCSCAGEVRSTCKDECAEDDELDDNTNGTSTEP